MLAQPKTQQQAQSQSTPVLPTIATSNSKTPTVSTPTPVSTATPIITTPEKITPCPVPQQTFTSAPSVSLPIATPVQEQQQSITQTEQPKPAVSGVSVAESGQDTQLINQQVYTFFLI